MNSNSFNVVVAYRFFWTPSLRRLVDSAGYCPTATARYIESEVNRAGGDADEIRPKAGTKAAAKPECKVTVGTKGKVTLTVAGKKFDLGDKIGGDLARVVSLNDTLESARVDFQLGASCGPDALPAWFRQWLAELPAACAKPMIPEPATA